MSKQQSTGFVYRRFQVQSPAPPIKPSQETGVRKDFSSDLGELLSFRIDKKRSERDQ